MTIDPYETLGVERDASEATIRKAYRGKSKTAHPDKGGKPEDWAAISTALTVLTDPEKRKTYDDTGRIDSDTVDNKRANALQIVEQQLASLISQHITSGFSAHTDPCSYDLPGRIIQNIDNEIRTGREGVKGGEKVVKFYEKLIKKLRLKKPNVDPDADPMGRSLKGQIAHAQEQIAGLKMSIIVHQMAREIAASYEFDADQASFTNSQSVPYGFTSFR